MFAEQNKLTAASTANSSTLNLAVPSLTQPRRLTAASSMALSESSSYHQREAELERVGKRFAGVLARSEPRVPRPSKFKEEFDAPAQRGLLTRSSMLLQKLLTPNADSPRPRPISRSISALSCNRGGHDIHELPCGHDHATRQRSQAFSVGTAQCDLEGSKMADMATEGLKPSATDL